MTKSSTMPWRALLLGAFLGFLISALTANPGEIKSGMERWLAHAEVESEVENHEGEEDGKEEEEIESKKADVTVTVIILFLVAMTIFFEHVKHEIEHGVDSTMEPVIEGLFGELTVLGFLSLVTFCVTRLGWFTELSENIFGEEEELFELFEVVHYILFFTMVFFVINVLVLLYGGKVMNKKWWVYNRACRDKEYMKQLDAALQSHPDDEHQTSYMKYLFWDLFPCRSSKHQLRYELQLFRGLRHEFVAERSFDPPFAPNASSNEVDDDFEFGSYLSICQAHNLAHMVHLSNSVWLSLAGAAIVYMCLAFLVDNQEEPFAWIWGASGWVFFVLGTYFDYHMVRLIGCMAARCAPRQQSGEESVLLPDTLALPEWTTIDLEKYMQERPLAAKCFVPAKSRPTRQDTLYWLERKGPKIYLILFQIHLLFTAMYVSFLCFRELPFMVWGSKQTTAERIIYPIFTLLPVYLLLSKYQEAVAILTMACSVGVHRRPQIISKVIRANKTARLVRRIVLLQKLQREAQNGFASSSGTAVQLSSGERQDAIVHFNSFDKSGDGTISSDELEQVLKKLRIAPTKETLTAMMGALDKDKNGSISRDEFLDFYRTHVVIELDDHGLHKLAEDMFAQVDSDGSGEITLGEFKAVLENYNVGMTVDEIAVLVNELDVHDNGTISEHEFVQLLTVTHRLLFDRTPLPKLE